MKSLLSMSEGASLALHGLALVAKKSPERVNTRELAVALSASEAHLAKVFQKLQRAGIVSLDQYKVLDGGYRFLRSLDVRLRLSQDSSIDQFDPNALEPETVGRYRKETGKIRKVYLELLGLPG